MPTHKTFLNRRSSLPLNARHHCLRPVANVRASLRTGGSVSGLECLGCVAQSEVTTADFNRLHQVKQLADLCRLLDELFRLILHQLRYR